MNRIPPLLPLLLRCTRPFRRPQIRAYREGGFWYVRDFNGFSKAENQLVCGVPELIEHWAGTATDEVRIRYSDRPFDGSELLVLLEADRFGATYEHYDGLERRLAWLCSVFFWYFPQAPRSLYVRVEATER